MPDLAPILDSVQHAAGARSDNNIAEQAAAHVGSNELFPPSHVQPDGLLGYVTFLLYFPFGKGGACQFLAWTQDGIYDIVVISLVLCPAGSVISLLRMGLWVTLLAVDLPWLTANNTGISGAECLLSFSVTGSLSILLHSRFGSVNYACSYAAAVLQALLGLNIQWHRADRIPAERHVLVSNHVTAGDLMVLYSRPITYTHLISVSLPPQACRVSPDPVAAFEYYHSSLPQIFT